MGLMIHLGLWLVALLCIRASAAAPPPSSSPRCLSLSPLSHITTIPIDNNTRNLTLFDHHSLDLSAAHPSCLTFTRHFTQSPPSLAFILVRSGQPAGQLVYAIQLTFCNFTTLFCPHPAQLLPLDFCNSRPLQTQAEAAADCSCSLSADSFDCFQYTVSLAYAPEDAALVVAQAAIHVDADAINLTVTLSTYGSPPYARGRDENITLFAGYITQGGTNISTMATVDTMSSASSLIDVVCRASPHENNSRSNHTRVVVWVLAVVFMVVFLIGLVVLALSLKRYRPRLSCRPAGQFAPSSTITPTPFPPPPPHLESGATPMMKGHPLSSTYDTNNFQMSGTTSWLKQPNAR